MKRKIHFYYLLMVYATFFTCEGHSQKADTVEIVEERQPNLKKYSKAYFAAGCFWCVETIYESLKGVHEVYAGYAGGTNKESPTYKKVSSGISNHAEAVVVYFNKNSVSFNTLVKVYFNSKDNVSQKCQGPDCGSAYRSILFYSNEEEKKIIEKIERELISEGEIPEIHNNHIQKINQFYLAEDYHQNFEKKHPQHSYVQSVSIPRFNRFKRLMSPNILKKTH